MTHRLFALAGGLVVAVALLAAGVPVIMATVHSSRVRPRADVDALAALTPAMDRLIVPSDAIAHKVRAEGREGARFAVIPNGVDLSRFRAPAPACRLRREFGIPADAPLVGVVARLEAAGVYEWVHAMSVPDAIEALVATGELDRAEVLASALTDWGHRFDRPWALATGWRCCGLLLAARRDLDGALAALEGALLQHERLEMPFERGRTLLVLGQLHRRRKEKRAARAALDEALAVFEQLGAPLWAVKARAELGRVAPRHGSGDTFTPTEERVAGLAASGLTNREIGERLFLSPKTVETNLARVYRKLGIHSRAELGVRMTERGSAAEV